MSLGKENDMHHAMMLNRCSDVCGDGELEHYAKMISEFLEKVRGKDSFLLNEQVYMHFTQLARFIHSIKQERRIRERVEKENQWLKDELSTLRLENSSLTRQWKDAFTGQALAKLAIALHNQDAASGKEDVG